MRYTESSEKCAFSEWGDRVFMACYLSLKHQDTEVDRRVIRSVNLSDHGRSRAGFGEYARKQGLVGNSANQCPKSMRNSTCKYCAVSMIFHSFSVQKVMRVSGRVHSTRGGYEIPRISGSL